MENYSSMRAGSPGTYIQQVLPTVMVESFTFKQNTTVLRIAVDASHRNILASTKPVGSTVSSGGVDKSPGDAPGSRGTASPPKRQLRLGTHTVIEFVDCKGSGECTSPAQYTVKEWFSGGN